MKPPRSFDERSRKAKAQKIAMLLGIVRPAPGAAILYIGSASSYVAAYFSKLGFGESGTFAVDIVDAEPVSSEYQLINVRGAELPFPDERFDFIISNHVIKHFAGPEQHRHLAEIARCLRDSGRLYIAVPNRWALIDAHYQLPLLGCLPRKLAHRYLRLIRKADAYEWYPLSRRAILCQLQEQSFQIKDVTLKAVRLSGRVQKTSSLRLAFSLPPWFWHMLRPVLPTLFFVCAKKASSLPLP